MKKYIILVSLMFIAGSLILFTACNSNNNQKSTNAATDSTKVVQNKSTITDSVVNTDASKKEANGNQITQKANTKQSVVLIYNFHVTNRCPSCIAIEKATTKTLDTYFSTEVKQGRIKRQILNVDDKANSAISEKYQAFGSGLFVTKVLNGKETTTDLTGDGFKFARNKEERFIEILKSIITEDLK